MAAAASRSIRAIAAGSRPENSWAGRADAPSWLDEAAARERVPFPAEVLPPDWGRRGQAPAFDRGEPRSREGAGGGVRQIDETKVLWLAAAVATRVLPDYEDLADWIGTDVETLRRWIRRDTAPQRARRAIQELAIVVHDASQVWASDAALRAWLDTPDPRLDERAPLDLLRTEGPDRVIEVLNSLRSGSSS